MIPAMKSEIEFAKLQGAGNGYIVMDGRGLELDWPGVARSVCHPHFGVGSDGLALAATSEVAPVRMRILNSDGSESEMSGNGIRLFAKYLLDRGLVQLEDGVLRIETGGGVREVVPLMDGDGASARMVAARVSMGVPEFSPAEIPLDVAALGGLPRAHHHPIALGDRTVHVTCLSIGNPHAVALLEEPIDDYPLEDIGPRVVRHPLFPNRVNFEIVNVLDRATLRARIFERGEGETLASGTGSTASMIAAHVHGLVDDAVEIRLRGGSLRVRWDGRGEAELEGPAVEVFRGVWPLRGVHGASAP
jgi:diaminopimelate epimerase